MERKKQRIVNYQLSIKNYPLYKDSAIEWIGEIPEHWEVKRIKDISYINKKTLTEKTPKDYEFDYVDISSVTYGVRGFISERMNFDNAPSRAKRMVRKGDTIISTVRTYLKAITSFQDEISNVIVSTGFAVVSPKKILNSKYFCCLATSSFLIDKICSSSVGVSYPATNASVIADLLCLVPPLSEQKAIADYLDTKTAQIDRKIDLLTQKVKRYEELKRAIINETVTRGLDKSVPMKDSAIDWIGEIPEHWEVNRLKDIARQSKEKNGNTHIGEMLSVSGYRGIEFKKYDDELKKRTDEELSDYRVVRPGQLVVNTMWLNYRGIGVSKLRGYVSPAYRAYFLNKTAYGTFIHYLMRSDLYVSGYSKYLQGIRPNSLQMKTIDFECLPMLVPPLPEQEAIADYLDTKTAQIDQIIQTITTQVEKLQELRKTLINDVVTGKIKVIDNG